MFRFGQGFTSFGIFGLGKHLTILPFKRRCHHLCVTSSTTVMNKNVVGEEDGRERENQNSLCTVQRDRAGDSKVERNSLT